MPKLIQQSVSHKNSIHSKTEYDSKRKLLTAHFTDGAVYQFLDIPESKFEEIKTVEKSKGDYKDLEDNDVISDYFFSHLWENIILRTRGKQRWFDKKMRFYYIKVKSPNNSKHGVEAYK